jgi:transcriptional regulator with XRE-family HTH domain
MPKTKRRATVPNKGGQALAAALDKEGDRMTDAEGKLGLNPGYVSDAIRGDTRPNYAKRLKFLAAYGIGLGLWDLNITPKVKAVSP